MKATDPYEFPYPECAPPLTKDSSDIAQIRDLALAVDTEVARIDQFAQDEFIRPQGCKVARGALGSLDVGVPVPWTANLFDNSPGATMNGTTGITVRQSGYYFISGYLSTTQTLDRTRVRLWLQGVGEILNEGVAYGAGSGTQMTGSILYPVYAGQMIQLIMACDGSSSGVNAASLACVRVTGI